MDTYSKRVPFLDIAKGITIILVVIGHSSLPHVVSKWIWSFHVPLFFMVSGMLFSKEKYPTFLKFTSNRLKLLAIPFILFSIIVLYIYSLIDKNISLNSFLNVGWQGIALWFIPVLFLTELLYYSICKFKPILILFILIILTIVGYYLYIQNVHFGWQIEVVFSAILFYGIGNILQLKIISLFNYMSIIHLYSLLILLLFLSFLFSKINEPRLDLCANSLGNGLPTFINAFIGIFFIFAFSRIIDRNMQKMSNKLKKILLFLGYNTFVILAFSQITMIVIINIFNRYFGISGILSSILRHIIMWIILYIIIVFIKNYCPWIIGRTKNNKIINIYE